MPFSQIYTRYGGKAEMLPIIRQYLDSIDIDTLVIPFGGGFTEYYDLQLRHPKKGRLCILNDNDNALITFNWLLQRMDEELLSLIDSTVYHEGLWRIAKEKYRHPAGLSEAQFAYFWWLTHSLSTMGRGTSFAKEITGGANKCVNAFNNKIKMARICGELLKKATILSRDAIEVLNLYNPLKKCLKTICTIDPPYIGVARGNNKGSVDQGPYSGYTECDFLALLNCLEKWQGYFLLMNYPSEFLRVWAAGNSFRYDEIQMRSSASPGQNKKKIEVIVTNIPDRVLTGGKLFGGEV
jgi:site-specific DNA-adenine methylase